VLVVIGFVVCLLSPQLLEQLTQWILALFDRLNVLDDSGRISVAAVLGNNLRACALCILYGLIPFVYLSALTLGLNALLLGVLAAYYLHSGQSLLLYAVSLLPHGIFELPALVLSFSLGLYLCGQVTRRCRGGEDAPSVRLALTGALRVFCMLIVPLLAAASVVEARITPAILSLFS
jgi:stage II sporulation protein M